jgi:hypothetical protein
MFVGVIQFAWTKNGIKADAFIVTNCCFLYFHWTSDQNFPCMSVCTAVDVKVYANNELIQSTCVNTSCQCRHSRDAYRLPIDVTGLERRRPLYVHRRDMDVPWCVVALDRGLLQVQYELVRQFREWFYWHTHSCYRQFACSHNFDKHKVEAYSPYLPLDTACCCIPDKIWFPRSLGQYHWIFRVPQVVAWPVNCWIS